MPERELLMANAKALIEGLNAQNIPNLGALVIFWDTQRGNPAIASNSPRPVVESVLREILNALAGMDLIVDPRKVC